ncbi:MAG: hypothetical protein IPM11_01540 [Micropruina sp.]|nr:hypothetical protein [Micropruina sp.]
MLFGDGSSVAGIKVTEHHGIRLSGVQGVEDGHDQGRIGGGDVGAVELIDAL